MAQLPEKFRPYFGDSDFEHLDIVENRAFIISRLYTKGGFSGIFWVDETYSDQDIIYAAPGMWRIKRRRHIWQSSRGCTGYCSPGYCRPEGCTGLFSSIAAAIRKSVYTL